MGKISGAITSLVFIGILAFVVYYCCLRRKRQRPVGTVIHVTSTRVPPATPNPMPNIPVNSAGIVAPGMYGYPYPAANNYGQQMHGQQYPYPGPTYPPMPMPMPMPIPLPQDNASHAQASAPFAQPPFDDLPPPYSEVTKR